MIPSNAYLQFSTGRKAGGKEPVFLGQCPSAENCSRCFAVSIYRLEKLSNMPRMVQPGINRISNQPTHVYESEGCMGKNYSQYFSLLEA